jgi:malate dehydrogenase (oxaloacetate-decarboxylating)
VVATGRSDYPNQINNVLAFPGVFRGLLDAQSRTVTDDMLVAAARALAGVVSRPSWAPIGSSRRCSTRTWPRRWPSR